MSHDAAAIVLAAPTTTAAGRAAAADRLRMPPMGGVLVQRGRAG
jgi:hypothetical protein